MRPLKEEEEEEDEDEEEEEEDQTEETIIGKIHALAADYFPKLSVQWPSKPLTNRESPVWTGRIDAHNTCAG